MRHALVNGVRIKFNGHKYRLNNYKVVQLGLTPQSRARDQATPGACDLAVTRFLRILPAEAMIKGQSRGIVGRHLERGRLPTSRQPLGQQCPPQPLTMPVGRHVEMMHEALIPPDGNKPARGATLFSHPELLAPGMLAEILKPKVGRVDPVKGLTPPLQVQLRQLGNIRLSHDSDHQAFLRHCYHLATLSDGSPHSVKYHG